MKPLFIIVFTFFYLLLFSQSSELFIPLNIREAYANKTRDLSGKPGTKYWQNKPSYRMDIEFDPVQYKINGVADITYINNSPDTLTEIVFTLLGDIYNKNNFSHDWQMDRSFMNDGVVIEEIKINDKKININNDGVSRSGTNMIIGLDKPLLPKANTDIYIKWSFIHPENLNIREGNYGDSTFMNAFFYPKIAVYDDLDGWDKHNYSGFAEFFGEFADYEVNITVPGDFKIWATGELQNPEKVLSETYLQRWKDAHITGKVVQIIEPGEFDKREVTLPDKKLNWTFKAQNVPDFAFGTSNRFLWDAKTIELLNDNNRKVFLNTAYGVKRKFYPRIIGLLDTVIFNFSTKFPGIPYPYPSMSIFNGNAGMEFPMMCNDAEEPDWRGNVGLTYHEAGHTYFPFYVGTNERKYAWMDEGWASFIPGYFMGSHIPADQFDYYKSRIKTYHQFAGNEAEVPIMTLTEHLRTRQPYRQASYNKSYIANIFLMEYLGEERFLNCLQEYIKRWAGKHPMPYDFFKTFNEISGENLDWFWKSWYFDIGYPDLGIIMPDSKTIVVENFGRLPLPFVTIINYEDGTNNTMEYNMKIWKNSKTKLVVPVTIEKKIRNITLENPKFIDLDTSNNSVILKK
ncbi:MAG: M1 family metallopeptidase [Saprospiraceae bacterium]|nr:M1 family metallopeptidase [Saprospiraceae bacterium]